MRGIGHVRARAQLYFEPAMRNKGAMRRIGP
jgi:hypothetical protein